MSHKFFTGPKDTKHRLGMKPQAQVGKHPERALLACTNGLCSLTFYALRFTTLAIGVKLTSREMCINDVTKSPCQGPAILIFM
ncbi:MAG: hypothetical protein D6814_06060 [Calditrichaeota bacterium]|nr:MAG: hypothetical protein D6814_06060 [Calditrichota bacterium]